MEWIVSRAMPGVQAARRPRGRLPECGGFEQPGPCDLIALPEVIGAEGGFTVPAIIEREGPGVVLGRLKQWTRITVQNLIGIGYQKPSPLAGYLGAPLPEFCTRGRLRAPHRFASADAHATAEIAREIWRAVAGAII